MNIKLLIDAIVQQTTVLVAQLSTNAGVRAPLAHLADQVFLSLSREIEAQGVGRKVVADMFGLALRGYQKKTQRTSGSATVQGKTLFEALLEYVERERGASRSAVLQRFRHDNEREVVSVLNDLVRSGLLYSTGTGGDTLYGVTTEAERQKLTRQSDKAALSNMALGAVYRCPGLTQDELCVRLHTDVEDLRVVLDGLLADGQVTLRDERLYAPTFQIPIGAAHGWEAAVFDHFQAVATAIGNKVQVRGTATDSAELIGGTTLRFEVSRRHPKLQRVLALLAQVRSLTDAVWDEVNEVNAVDPPRDDERVNVTFYFGQNLDDLSLLSGSVGPGND